MPSAVTIRPESAADATAVFDVHVDAFPTDDEAKLVERLRGDPSVVCSLVAEAEGRVVGHVLFTPVEIDAPHATVRGVGLGPLAVRQSHQRRGIGSSLTREGLSRCREAAEGIVVVLGHPEYYPRFGFTPAWERGLYFLEPKPNPAFMALELKDGAIPDGCGEVRYHPAIMALD